MFPLGFPSTNIYLLFGTVNRSPMSPSSPFFCVHHSESFRPVYFGREILPWGPSRLASRLRHPLLHHASIRELRLGYIETTFPSQNSRSHVRAMSTCKFPPRLRRLLSSVTRHNQHHTSSILLPQLQPQCCTILHHIFATCRYNLRHHSHRRKTRIM